VRNQQKLVYISKSDHLCVDLVMMPSGAVERQRRYIARIASKPSNGIKIVSVLQRLHSEIWRTISDVQKRDEQKDKTNRQKTSTFLATPAAGEMDLEHVLAPQKF